MNKLRLFALSAVVALFAACSPQSSSFMVEAESFDNKGGWVVDQQFMDLMGSPYLMAHGMGIAVEDASTQFDVAESGDYHIYLRTFNWTSVWHKGEGPGKFKLSVDGRTFDPTLGVEGDRWMWQYVGQANLAKGKHSLTLHDLTGFNGRCDAIYFSQENVAPPCCGEALTAFRRELKGMPCQPKVAEKYDLVVAGAGIAGMCAAVSAARNGLKVALINDRPVLGGCNSAEIRVHLGGRIEVGPYKNLGNLIKEFGHTKRGNAEPAENYEDDRKQEWIDAESNITLYASNRLTRVIMDGSKIKAVISEHIESGIETMFEAPLFVDCTGDGTVGGLAGADFRMGREAKSEFNEYDAPEVADMLVMGSSVQWYSEDDGKPSTFPIVKYGVNFDEVSKEDVTMGEWTWEAGAKLNQLTDFERIRDYGMLVIFSNWSFLKNEASNKADYANRSLEWVAYVAGKRESRRLMGDYILTGNDVIDYTVYPDGTAASTWSVDLHYPDPVNSVNFPDAEFKSIAKHHLIYEYPVPYRCLYSRNVENLFMAGRNISVTHMALGTIRVMRTTGMLGEVVGMAAAICKENNCNPRGVYTDHLDELIAMMKEGAGEQGLPNNQQFNTGGHLKEPRKAGDPLVPAYRAKHDAKKEAAQQKALEEMKQRRAEYDKKK
ncbi:MAG: FAD-dependent oxidoreductase [Rikenellaceae bacterium]